MKKMLLMTIVFLLSSCGGGGGGGNGETTSSTPTQPKVTIATTPNKTAASIRWSNSFPSNNEFSVKIYLDNTLTYELTNTNTFTFESLTENTTYTGSITLTDLSTNQSISENFSFTTLSNRAPQFFKLQGTQIDKQSMTITWPDAHDPDGDSLIFRVQLNDQTIIENTTEKSATFDNLQPNTEYRVHVEASDPQGKNSNSQFRFTTRNDDGQLSLHSATIDTLIRQYVVFKPDNPEHKKRPLVIWFHGAGYQLPADILKDYWIELANRENFYLLAPLAISDDFQKYTYWNAGMGPPKDDIKLVQTAIDSLIDQGDIDTDRIYAAGMSSGGHMTYYTALKLQDQLAAIAPIAGSIATYTLYPTVSSPGVFDSYFLRKPMPLCHIHGDGDTIVKIDGDSWYTSWDRIRSYWILNNKTDRAASITQLPDINETDRSTVTKYEYRGATAASDIDDYLINNGGHSIPGVESYGNQDMNAYDVIWEFFKKHKLSDPY